ncbi:MAG TPA: hypothetical protein VJT72_21200 [Pseudonocardiaceae bacterium]|nr:hypothetical protein [Pseudonocardiaceae bacterium]
MKRRLRRGYGEPAAQEVLALGQQGGLFDALLDQASTRVSSRCPSAASDRREKEVVRVLLHAEQLAPQLIYHDVFVRETLADLLRAARRGAGGRELRGLAWRLGVTPIG